MGKLSSPLALSFQIFEGKGWRLEGDRIVHFLLVQFRFLMMKFRKRQLKWELL